MFCKNCGKEIDDDSKFCQYCGVEITNKETIDTDSKERRSKFNAIHIILFIICATVAGSFVNVAVKNITSKVFNKNTRINKDLKDAMFLYGFTTVNTNLLKTYCKDTGHIPQKYINSFNSRFFKTTQYMNNILQPLNNDNDIVKLKQSVNESLLSQLENDFDTMKMQNPNLTKRGYCQIYDNYSKELINQKVETINKARPELFKD